MTRKTLFERLTHQLATSLADAKRAAKPEEAAEAAALDALKMQKAGDKVDNVGTLSWVLATTIAAIPDALRFEMHRAVFLAVEEWLPEGSMLRPAMLVALPLIGAEIEQLLKKNNVTAKELDRKIRPVIQREFDKLTTNTHAPEEGDGDTMNDNDKQKEGVKTLVEARALLVESSKIVDRLLRLLSGDDLKVLTDTVTKSPEAIEAIIINWGPTKDTLADSKKIDDNAFLANPQVHALLVTLKVAYEQGKAAPATTVVAEVGHAAENVMDAVTKLLHDIKVPAQFHDLLKRMMKVDVESTIDDVENFLYPKVEKALQATAGAVLFALGALLLFVGVMSAVYTGSTSEWAIARDVMSWQEFFLLRAGGAAFNHAVVIVGGLTFAIIGGIVMRPYDKRPTEPKKDASAADKAKFAEEDDKWREGYRDSLTVRVLAASWSVTIGASLVLIFGAVALAWQFQWATALMIVGVVFLVGLAVLWPLDDGLSKLLRTVEEIVRGHKISTTLFIAVIGGIVMYVPAVLTVPPTGARVGAFFVILLVALAAILPNRVLAGGPAHDKEVGDVIAKTRRVMAATLPFWVAGLALGVGFITLAGFGTSYAYHWSKECTGYESVPECSALEGGGLHTYVDNHDRWVAMRDRSARARESAHMPVGDACTVATRKVDAMEHAYAEAIGSMQGGESSHGMCADMAAHREDWGDPDLKEAVDACSRKAAACKE